VGDHPAGPQFSNRRERTRVCAIGTASTLWLKRMVPKNAFPSKDRMLRESREMCPSAATDITESGEGWVSRLSYRLSETAPEWRGCKRALRSPTEAGPGHAGCPILTMIPNWKPHALLSASLSYIADGAGNCWRAHLT